jgi:hypothetical protein
MFLYNLKDKVGFEPTVQFSTTVFKTIAISHSAIYPKGINYLLILIEQKQHFLRIIKLKFFTVITTIYYKAYTLCLPSSGQTLALNF